MTDEHQLYENQGAVVCIFLGFLLLTSAACQKKNSHSEIAKPSPVPAAGSKPRELRDIKYERTAKRLERGKYLTEGLLQCFKPLRSRLEKAGRASATLLISNVDEIGKRIR